MKTIDFAIIGAGKSGTTSLFRYLSAHPDIYMPEVKELSFFAVPSLYEKTVEWYHREFYANVESSLLWGEASPAYMSYQETPHRLVEYNPDLKLIALLRNPVDRAFSHHQHLVRAGRERRGFSECIRMLVERGRVPDSEIECSDGWHCEYVMDGEYGRLLENYLNFFPASQMRVYFFEDLVSDPHSLTEDLYEWLGVQAVETPSVVGKVYNPGGTLRLPMLTNTLRWAVKHGVKVRWLNDALRAVRLRSLLAKYWFRFNTEIAVKRKTGTGPSREDRDFLTNHFREDVMNLQELLNLRVPWRGFLGDTQQGEPGEQQLSENKFVA